MLSDSWAVALTVIFSVTGVYCLWRWVSRYTVRRTDREPAELLVDLNHVVMSVAMVVMVWWPAGTAGRWVQVGIFAVLGLAFGAQLSRAGSASERAGGLTHLVMDAAMVWMLAAMPQLMAGMTSAGPGMDMPGMSMPGEDSISAGVAATPIWAGTVNWVAVGALALAAGWWVVSAIRSAGHRVHCSCHGLMGVGMGLMLVAMHPGL